MNKSTTTPRLGSFLSSSDPDPYESRLQTIKDQVLAEASEENDALGEMGVTETQKVRAIQLQTELNSARFRKEAKKRRLSFLKDLSSTLQYEQETVNGSDPSRTSHQTSFLEFQPAVMVEKVAGLQDKLEQIQTRIEMEWSTCDQMEALLRKTKEATLREKAKMDQLRYLQKRLFRRHGEIVTMQARASNEFIRANHQTIKATESSLQEKRVASEKIRDKKLHVEGMKHEVETLAEMTAKRILKEQVSRR